MTPSRLQAATTLQRTIGLGDVLRRGSRREYRALRWRDGEPTVLREDLATRHGRRGTTSLLHLAHLTDLQLADVQSPGRLEFLHDHVGQPGFELLIPMFRPQELLGVHAAEAMVATLEAVGPSPLTGAALQAAVTTGDNIDNAQLDELGWYLTVLSGGRLDQRTGGPEYDGPQDGTDPRFWSPEGSAPDRYRTEYGYPAAPGLLAAAAAPFTATGLSVPWYTAYGNHDGLFQGRAAFDGALAAALTGARKPVALPAGPVPDIVTDALAFLAGPARSVTPDPARRPVTRREFVEAHFGDGGRPDGHGFTEDNRGDGTAYYVSDDLPGVRLVTLDTTNPHGAHDGSLDRRQLQWLERQLAEVHSRHLDAAGRWVEGSGDDRLVVLCSHHGADTLTNPLGAPEQEGPRVLAPELLATLHRFPNVVLWLNGHVHRHAVRPHRGPAGGFWEVTTAAVMDWPCQARLVEVLENPDGTLSVVCTVLDSAAPLRASGLDGVLDLAAWHRELAANDPTGVGGAAARGLASDRNVELLLPDPRRR
jgi:metallophosphoesterase (TIGR03767 family)